MLNFGEKKLHVRSWSLSTDIVAARGHTCKGWQRRLRTIRCSSETRGTRNASVRSLKLAKLTRTILKLGRRRAPAWRHLTNRIVHRAASAGRRLVEVALAFGIDLFLRVIQLVQHSLDTGQLRLDVRIHIVHSQLVDDHLHLVGVDLADAHPCLLRSGHPRDFTDQ